MKQQTRDTIRIYWQHTRPHWVLLSIMLLTIIGGSAMNAVVPLYFKQFFDALTTTGLDKSAVYALLISALTGVAVAEAVKWFFWRAATFINSHLQTRVMADIATTCFRYVHKHSFAYFNGNFVGSLVKRFNWFIRAYEGTLDKICWNIIPLAVNIVAVMFVLSQHFWFLAVILGIWVLIFMAVNWLFVSYKFKYDLQRSDAESQGTALLADTITNNANVKLFNGYEREVAANDRATDKIRKLRLFTWQIDDYFDATQGVLVISLEIAIFYYTAQLWLQGLVTVGDFALIQSYIIIILNDIWNFGKIIRNVYIDLADAEEMTIALTKPHDITDARRAKPLVVKRGGIVFDEVGFYYHNTRKIISNFDLAIKPHEKIALVGPSGAGKSTIVKLIMRNYDLTAGKILVDDQDIAKVTQESLWSAISLVPQDPILFHRSLMENIRYGKSDATDDEVIAAAKLAHCHEFITEFPETYNTFVGERGVKLSGGERQRVAIARAILRNAPILVLDEATSSLDSESEHLIQDALNILMKNKTVIVIAHRLSTIMKMDRIIVVDGGSIIERGTHNQLIKQPKSLYAKLWKLQVGGFMAEPVGETGEEA